MNPTLRGDGRRPSSTPVRAFEPAARSLTGMLDYGAASIRSKAMLEALSRRDYPEAMFRDGKKLELVCAALVPACAKADWRIHPSCLLPNLTSGGQYAKVRK